MSRRSAWNSSSFCRNTFVMIRVRFRHTSLQPLLGSPYSSTRSRSSKSPCSCPSPREAVGRSLRRRLDAAEAAFIAANASRHCFQLVKEASVQHRYFYSSRATIEATIDNQHHALLPSLLRLLVLQNPVNTFGDALVAQANTGEGVQCSSSNVAGSDSCRRSHEHAVCAILLFQGRDD